jgi:hypothetical protein
MGALSHLRNLIPIILERAGHRIASLLFQVFVVFWVFSKPFYFCLFGSIFFKVASMLSRNPESFADDNRVVNLTEVHPEFGDFIRVNLS